MKILLDTDICIYVINGKNPKPLERFLLPLEIIPFDVEAGLFYGRIRMQLKRIGLC